LNYICSNFGTEKNSSRVSISPCETFVRNRIVPRPDLFFRNGLTRTVFCVAAAKRRTMMDDLPKSRHFRRIDGTASSFSLATQGLTTGS
jgi:hypothetical protein